jgi:hypothetical protein
MTSLPCYEILGLDRKVEQTATSISEAYERMKEMTASASASASGQWLEDIEAAYEILSVARTRDAYVANWVPFKESEWAWHEHEDADGAWRTVKRLTKDGRTQRWAESDDVERRNIKKQGKNERRGDRDKRRGAYGGDE